MGKKKIKKNKSIYKTVGFYLSILYVILTIALIAQLMMLNVLPMKFAIPIAVVLVFIMLGLCVLQLNRRISKVNSILGKILMILLSVLLAFGNLYIFKAGDTMTKITDDGTQKKSVSIVVLKDNKAETVKDLKDVSFGIQKSGNQEIIENALKDIKSDLGTSIESSEYTSNQTMVDELFDETVNAIVIDEATRSLLEDYKEDFTKETKVIHTYEYSVESIVKSTAVDVTKDPFNVYITGMDTYGEIATTSRSDVNMIASINPTTHQILLISVPRDFYVEQTCQGNQKDKLTHTGIFGVDCTIDSMKNFMGVTMNYYVRVNFSSLEKIVDAIGGINVYNQMGFYSGVDSSYIPEGNLHMNGNTALKFARERKAYGDGDRQRGRNQMIVLEAIIKQAISPSIITGYVDIMDAVGSNIQTNMAEKDMTSLIKKQLEDMSGWDFRQISLNGDGSSEFSPALGDYASMMIPDMNSVNSAVSLIKKIDAGETITDEDIAAHTAIIEAE